MKLRSSSMIVRLTSGLQLITLNLKPKGASLLRRLKRRRLETLLTIAVSLT